MRFTMLRANHSLHSGLVNKASFRMLGTDSLVRCLCSAASALHRSLMKRATARLCVTCRKLAGQQMRLPGRKSPRSGAGCNRAPGSALHTLTAAPLRAAKARDVLEHESHHNSTSTAKPRRFWHWAVPVLSSSRGLPASLHFDFASCSKVHLYFRLTEATFVRGRPRLLCSRPSARARAARAAVLAPFSHRQK